jgi:hypothetical protein
VVKTALSNVRFVPKADIGLQRPMRGYIVPALRPYCSNEVCSFLFGGMPSVRRQLAKVSDVWFGQALKTKRVPV